MARSCQSGLRELLATLLMLSACGGDGASAINEGGEGGAPDVLLDLPETDCPANEMSEDILISGDAELEVLEGVTRIDGSLSIAGDVSSLGPLSCLRSVDGPVSVYRTSGLKTLRGLESLVTTHDISISENADLETTEGLGIQEIQSNDSPFATGSLRVRQNPRLAEMRFDELRILEFLSLGGCTQNGEGGNIQHGNSVLVRLDAGVLPNLESEEMAISVSGYSELLEIDAFLEALRGKVTFLSLRENARLDIITIRSQLEGSNTFIESCGNLGDDATCMCPPGGE